MSATSNQLQPAIPIESDVVLREKNAFRISLVTGVAMTLISIVSAYATIQAEQNIFLLAAATGLIAVAAFIGAWLSKRGRAMLGSAILIITILVTSLSLLVSAQGQGLPVGVILIVIVSAIATSTLPSYWATRATIAGIAFAVFITVTDLFTPDFGVATEPLYTYIFAGILALVYGFIIVRRFPSYSLGSKIILTAVLIALVPLAILGFRNVQSTRALLIEQTNQDLLEAATLSAYTLDNFVKTNLNSIRIEAQIIDLVEYLNQRPGERKGSLAEEHARNLLANLKKRDPVYIESYAILDINGTDLLDTSAEEIDSDKSASDYFLEPTSTGLPYVSPVRITPNTRQSSLYFSAPIRDQAQNIIGVLRVRINGNILQNLLSETSASKHEEEYAVLVDAENYIRLAHTLQPGLNFKSYANLQLEQILLLQKESLLPTGSPEELSLAQSEVVQGLDNLDQTPFFTAPAAALDNRSALSAGVRLSSRPWIVLVREPESNALMPVEDQTRTAILLALLIAGVAVAAGVFMAQTLSGPLVSLTNTAEKVTSGDLNARATITTADEIGTLARTFNNMTDQLQQTLGGLEQRVAARTVDLEEAILQSEKRAQELRAIAEVSRVIATEQIIEKLLPLVADLVSERFGFYHAGIFLLDENQQYAILRAASSEGGKRMLAREHKLEVGHTGIVGYVAKFGRPRIALDVGADATFFNNPDLPQTRSEMAIPLKLRGKITGILDVQSTQSGAFTQADADTLSVLGDQIAIAIENARLFSETQQALAEAQALYRRFISQQWEHTARQTDQTGYVHAMSGGKALHKPVQSEMIRRAIAEGDVVVFTPDNQADASSLAALAVPIKLSDQIIGVLDVRSPDRTHRWSEAEISIARAVAERVALALENARLLEDTSSRAEREQLVSAITTKIRSTNDPAEMIKTAVQELQQALNVNQIQIVPYIPPQNPEQ
jgi:GAF domain-containing protein